MQNKIIVFLAKPNLSMEGQRVRAHAACALQSREDLPAVTIHTSLSDLHLFRAWDESGWSIEQDKPPSPTGSRIPPVDPLLQ